jgi:thiol-disulfide isomerase/thioredoxin
MRRMEWMVAALMIATIGSVAAAQETTTLDALTVGDAWQGPAYDREAMRGCVVAVEFWGFNCPPCRASLPHLAKWDEEMRDKGLRILGVHSQNVGKDQVMALVRDNKIGFPIYDNGQVKGKPFSGIPKMFVFDHEGKLIYDGHPTGARKIIEEAVAKIPPPLPGPGEFKKLGAIAKKLATCKGLGATMVELDKKAQDKDEETVKEAQTLLERVKEYGNRRVKSAESCKTSDPALCEKLYGEIAENFKGSSIGDQAAETLKALKNDNEFQNAVKAAKYLAEVRKLQDQLKPAGGSLGS